MLFNNEEWLAVSKNPHLRALDVSVIFASSLFWSWLTLIAIAPIFCTATQLDRELSLVQLVIFGCGSLVLLLSAFLPKSLTRLLDSRRWETAAGLVSVTGGALAFWGSKLPDPYITLAGAVLIGLTFPYFLLEWSRMYSRRGSRTSAPLIAGSLALSFLADVLILAIAPSERSLFIIVLPLVIIMMLYAIQALVRSAQNDNSGLANAHEGPVAIGATQLMTIDPDVASQESTDEQNKRTLPLQHVVLLFAGAAAFGFAAGLIATAASSVSNNVTTLLVTCAMAALLVFWVTCLKPALYHIVTNGLIVVGFGGLLLGPSSSLEGHYVAGAPFIAALIGLLAFFLYLWPLLSYFATLQRSKLIPLFSLGFLAVDVGFLACVSLSLLSPVFAPDQTAYLLATFLFLVAVLCLFASGSVPIDLFHASTPIDLITGQATSTNHTMVLAQTVAERHGLTEREQEILELLLIGRSRPRIAETLCVSENTVNSHIQHIYRKVGVHGLQELLDYIYRNDKETT